MMSPRRLPPEVLRTRYVRAHKALQAALEVATKQKLRIEILEAENKALHAERDALRKRIEEKADA